MYRQFNTQYFGGRLPDYKILVVYDVWYWETERCGYPPCDPSVPDADGFIDFSGRQIFIRFLAHQTTCPAMEEVLLHEMAHAATDGEHGDNWQAEMARLKDLGAPVNDDDIEEKLSGLLTESEWDRILASSGWRSKGPIQ